MPANPSIWLAPFNIHSHTGGQQTIPRVIQLTDGRILVAWQDTIGGSDNTDIFGQLYDEMGQSIGGQFQINRFSRNGYEDDFDIVATDDGGFHITYTTESSLWNDDVAYEQYGAPNSAGEFGTPVGGISVPNIPGGGLLYKDPSLAISASGDGLLIYSQDFAAQSAELYIRTYDPHSQTYGEPVTIFNKPDARVDYQKITALENGNFAIVFRVSDDNSPSYIESRVYTPEGALIDSSVQTQTPGLFEFGVELFDVGITALSTGGFVTTWSRIEGFSGQTTEVYINIFDNFGNETVSSIEIVSSSPVRSGQPYEAYYVAGDVLGLRDGSFIVAYYDTVGQDRVFLAQCDAEGVELTTPDTRLVFDARYALDSLDMTELPDGRIAITFQNFVNNSHDSQMIIVDFRDAPSVGTQNNLIGTGGDDVVQVADYQSLDFYLAPGDDIVIISSGVTVGVLDGGLGNDSLSFAETGPVQFDLGLGQLSGVNFTFSSIAGFENVVGSRFSDELIGDHLDNILTGGRGNDILTGGLGADKFVFGFGEGQDVITDFNASEDVIEMTLSPYTTLYGLRSMMSQFDGYVVMNLGSNQFVRFNGLTIEQFGLDNFRLTGITEDGVGPFRDPTDLSKDDTSPSSSVEKTVPPVMEIYEGADQITLSEALKDLPSVAEFRTINYNPIEDLPEDYGITSTFDMLGLG